MATAKVTKTYTTTKGTKSTKYVFVILVVADARAGAKAGRAKGET